MSTDIDGSLPSVTLDPTRAEPPGAEPSGAEPPGAGTSESGPSGSGPSTPEQSTPEQSGSGQSGSGPTWLQDEMRRRMAAATGAGGRHARRGPADPPTSSTDHDPRHGDPPPPSFPRPRPPRSDTSLPGIRPVTAADDPWSRPAPAGGRAPLAGPHVPAAGGPRSPSPTGPPVRRRRPEPPGPTAAARLLDPATAEPGTVSPALNPARPDPGPGVPGPAARAVAPPADLVEPDPYDRDPSVRAPHLPGLDTGALRDDFARDGRARDGRARDGHAHDGHAHDVDLDDDDADFDDADFDDADLDDADLDDDLPIGPGGERILWSATPPPAAPFPPAPFPAPFPRVLFPGPGRAGGLAVAERPAADPADPDRPATVDLAVSVPGEGAPGEGRTRVVLSERRGIARPVRNVVELQESGTVGDLLRSNLIGSQLTVALRFAVGGGLVLLLLPALFWLSPAIGLISVLGLRLPWLLLGVAVYPFLLGLGLWFTRTAERAEKNFADQVQDS